MAINKQTTSAREQSSVNIRVTQQAPILVTREKHPPPHYFGQGSPEKLSPNDPDAGCKIAGSILWMGGGDKHKQP